MSWGRKASSVRILGVAAIVASSVFAAVGAGSSVPAGAATGANFIATGHDMDFHCSGGDTDECAYLKIVTDKVRNGSTLPILALDQGTELPTALTAAGESPVTTVDPSNATVFNATAFVDGTGKPKFSAIITASDESCGGCDNTSAGEANINARKNDFTAFFNGGGGILALTAGSANQATYYDFVPLSGLGAVAVSSPFTVTPTGMALGITDAMVNCCATHNSFNIPPSPLVVLESDSTGKAETIAAFGASIGGGGFTSVAASKTADFSVRTPGTQDGYTVTFTNTGTAAATLTSVTDTLPAGFTYLAGSTTGGTTTDPTGTTGTLTWTGPFNVPAGGTFVFHFNVSVSSTPGHYTNSVAAAAATAVTPAASVAPIDVATVVPTPAFPVKGLPIAFLLGGGTLWLWMRRRRRPPVG